MKRRHGINTSHTKHLNNQQLQQSTEQTQPPQIQQSTENPLSIPQTESTTVQVNIIFLFLFHVVCFVAKLRIGQNFQIIQYFTCIYIKIEENDKLKHSRW